MPEDKRKINAWIPIELYEKVVSAGYSSTTEAIIKGLEMLFQDTKESSEDNLGYIKDIQLLHAENETLKEQILKAPDPGEYIQLHTRCNELQEHNSTLKKDLQDLKDMHNNYMLQVQTLINQKAIQGPGKARPWWKIW
ncbi:hypothetical protein [Methanomethylovorans sp.]|uniref:hypothetical protein n=1 Tax=Methanomethylovorans sp. TaxID=2758717 RepID=UPI00351BEF78